MSEETIRELCLWAAGAIAALWGGSKVNWSSLLSVFKRKAAEVVSSDPKAPKDTHGNGSVADAIYVLRVNAPNVEFQKLVTAVDDAFWAAVEASETK